MSSCRGAFDTNVCLSPFPSAGESKSSTSSMSSSTETKTPKHHCFFERNVHFLLGSVLVLHKRWCLERRTPVRNQCGDWFQFPLQQKVRFPLPQQDFALGPSRGFSFFFLFYLKDSFVPDWSAKSCVCVVFLSFIQCSTVSWTLNVKWCLNVNALACCCRKEDSHWNENGQVLPVCGLDDGQELTVVHGFVRNHGGAGVEVALQRVDLTTQDVPECLHLRQLLLQPAPSLCKTSSSNRRRLVQLQFQKVTEHNGFPMPPPPDQDPGISCTLAHTENKPQKD